MPEIWGLRPGLVLQSAAARQVLAPGRVHLALVVLGFAPGRLGLDRLGHKVAPGALPCYSEAAVYRTIIGLGSGRLYRADGLCYRVLGSQHVTRAVFPSRRHLCTVHRCDGTDMQTRV